MRVYLLLDRSGSMSSQWNDTLGAINSYVKALPRDTNVYLAAFDSGFDQRMNYKVLRNTTARAFNPLTEVDAAPRGGTPFLDAAARILDHAFAESPEQAYIVFMTDGEENTSRTATKALISEKLARAEDRSWEVVFLGANFDNVVDQARGIGLNLTKSYSIDTRNLGDEMAWLGAQTVAYAKCGTRTEFTNADRIRAKK